MVDYTDDNKLLEKVGKKSDDDITLLGVGVFGDNDKVKELTKGFKLWS